MRKLFFVLFSILFASIASAQWSVGAGGTFTKFSQYQKGKLGFLTRTTYEKPSLGVIFTYHYHLPFNDFNILEVRNGSNDRQFVESTVKLNFQVLQLLLKKSTRR